MYSHLKYEIFNSVPMIVFRANAKMQLDFYQRKKIKMSLSRSDKTQMLI